MTTKRRRKIDADFDQLLGQTPGSSVDCMLRAVARCIVHDYAEHPNQVSAIDHILAAALLLREPAK